MYPVWFKLAWIDVPSFTALMVLALGVGLALTWGAARRAGLPSADVLDVALVAVLVGVIGARAGYVAVNWTIIAAIRATLCKCGRVGWCGTADGLAAWLVQR